MIFVMATLTALAVGAQGAAAAPAQGRGNGGAPAVSVPGSNPGVQMRGLNRADTAAGTRGVQGRTNARTRGANKSGFCPPRSGKKTGQGSRFQC